MLPIIINEILCEFKKWWIYIKHTHITNYKPVLCLDLGIFEPSLFTRRDAIEGRPPELNPPLLLERRILKCKAYIYVLELWQSKHGDNIIVQESSLSLKKFYVKISCMHQTWGQLQKSITNMFTILGFNYFTEFLLKHWLMPHRNMA